MQSPRSIEAKALPVVHRVNWLGWGSSIICGSLVLWLCLAAVGAGLADMGVVRDYLFSPQILQGAWNALVLGSLAFLIAVLVGLLFALMRVSGNPVLATIAAIYVFFFRGVPMLIQLVFWFNAVPVMFPNIVVSVPMTSIVLYSAPTIAVVTPFVAALVGLSLAEGSHVSEIIRSGLQAVDGGQRSAARALGMTRIQIYRRIVLPQTSRIILPAIGNQYVLLLKSSALASAVGYLELLRVATDLYSSNFRVVELLMVAAFWYLVMTALATMLQIGLEKRFPAR